ncbi:hypothetical protein VST7929_02292 [Vibrio stylophorae]|uniref:Uncharacterized protein n=1 Tax=Vibrio stylophorae TaxID=659351 RepID=A0ABN8DTE7_9VIBR|nr:hypothetical protein [Vibrio stylophorae]CAH0534361.1 hypothetical protein VST7929_02292 [Vibrio stylophorae]
MEQKSASFFLKRGLKIIVSAIFPPYGVYWLIHSGLCRNHPNRFKYAIAGGATTAALLIGYVQYMQHQESTHAASLGLSMEQYRAYAVCEKYMPVAQFLQIEADAKAMNRPAAYEYLFQCDLAKMTPNARAEFEAMAAKEGLTLRQLHSYEQFKEQLSLAQYKEALDKKANNLPSDANTPEIAD